MALNITVLAIVILLLPMLYLALASPAFLLVRLDTPQVAYLLRTMFFGYFLALLAAESVAAILNAVDGRLVQAGFIALAVGLAAVWRQWMMPRLEALLAATEAGLSGVGPRLRRLHWAGMLANAAQLATVIAFIPSLVVIR